MPGVSQRSYVAGHFLLTLDGVDAGFVKSIEGGAIHADVINETVGPSYFVKKHIGPPRYEDFTIQVGAWMQDALYDWIAASWKMNYQRKNGSIVNYDFNFEARSQREFFNALVTEVQIPAMDGASKDQAYMTVKFQAETAEHKLVSSGPKVTAKSPGSQTMWLPSNFKLEIDGLDVQRVGKIDSFTLKQNVKPFTTGPDWMYQIEPTSLEYPNLSVYVALSNAEPWFTWHKEFVVEGKNGPDKEKTGAITLIDSTLSQTLLTINLKSVGIVNISPDKADASGQDQVKRVKIELYVEEMDFVFP